MDAWTFSYEHFKMMAFAVNMHALDIKKTEQGKSKRAETGATRATPASGR